MKKFFILFAAFLLSGNAPAQSAEEKNAAAIDPDQPAPASPVHLSLPHSERTKSNILDMALDFLFIRFFNRYPGVNISYDFFEIDSQKNLSFKNFTAKITRPDVQGSVVVDNILVDFSEFMNVIKSSKAEISKINLERVSGDMEIIKSQTEQPAGKTQENRRQLKISVREIELRKFILAFWGAGQNPDQALCDASARDFRLSLSNPTEEYAAASAIVNGIVFKEKKTASVTFSSAEVDGKKYDTPQELLKAIKRK